MLSKVQKLILGTVQFGLDYGINNTQGRVPEKEANNILTYAQSVGIKTLDTAAGYGDSEERIGEFHIDHKPFQIITKFDKTLGLNWEKSIQISLEKLRIPFVEIAMFHSFESYYKSELERSDIILRGKGKYFKDIGVSVYTNEELAYLVSDKNIDIVQLPFNLLDNENIRGNLLKKLKDRGKKIHVRSVFLQGLFYKKIEDLPIKLTPLIPFLTQVNKLIKENNVSMNALALQYAASKDYIDNLLIGVESKIQLIQNIQALESVLDEKIFQEVDKIKVENQELLNPSKW